MIENSPSEIKTISILGCGWYGLELAKTLISLGYLVKGSTTTPEKIPLLAEEKIKPFLINFTSNTILADESFFETDVLFICIPPKRNSLALGSYPDKINSILAIAKGKAFKIILISTTSVYSEENKVVNEGSETIPDSDSGKVVLAAEEIFKKQYPLDYTIIRFAGLIGPNRNPGRFFAGKTNIPNGLAPVNLIHQIDAIGLSISILSNKAFGRIYNACSPSHPTKKDFYTQAAKDSGLIAPEFLEEKTKWKIVESLNATKYLAYEFRIRI